jgi:DNA-binding PadR family transcriptional regulator
MCFVDRERKRILTHMFERGMKFGGRGFGHHGGGHHRLRRGEIKYHLLEMVKDTPRHGYEIITELERKSGLRPSPGSVYPTLQMLEEGGFVTSEQVDGKKVYTITDEGRRILEERGVAETEADPRRQQAVAIRQAMMKLGTAVMDAARSSDEETIKRITQVVDNARREVYSILAEA